MLSLDTLNCQEILSGLLNGVWKPQRASLGVPKLAWSKLCTVFYFCNIFHFSVKFHPTLDAACAQHANFNRVLKMKETLDNNPPTFELWVLMPGNLFLWPSNSEMPCDPSVQLWFGCFGFCTEHSDVYKESLGPAVDCNEFWTDLAKCLHGWGINL